MNVQSDRAMTAETFAMFRKPRDRLCILALATSAVPKLLTTSIGLYTVWAAPFGS